MNKGRFRKIVVVEDQVMAGNVEADQDEKFQAWTWTWTWLL